MNINHSTILLSEEARLLHGKVLENLIVHADIAKLRRAIHDFKGIDFRCLSDEEIEKRIDEVLNFTLDSGAKVITYFSEYSEYSTKKPSEITRFYRVRKLKNADMPNEDLNNLSSYWNPPRNYVTKFGRLNKPGESVLYTAFNPYTAMCESNLNPGDSFVLCVYEPVDEFRVSWIGGKTKYEFNGISNPKAIEFFETVKRFLVDEFSKIVSEGDESLYRITEIIAKKYYNTPNHIGWRYPSIKRGTEYNVCFRAKGIRQNLKLIGAITAIFNESNETDPHKITMTAKYVVVGPNMKKYFPYHSKEGERYMKKLFPEF